MLFKKRTAPANHGSDKRWSKTNEFDEAWKKRIARMASYINIPGTVADFGCGMMWLEPLLKPGNGYLPIDYRARDERTLVLDLNRDPLPPLGAQIAFLSGVLEYVEQVDVLARNLAQAGVRKIIASYCTLEKFSNLTRRQGLNWVSHLPLSELLAAFLPHFDLVALDDVNGNTILVFDRKSA